MPHDHHDHLSPSGHPYRQDNDGPLSYWQTMEIAVRELMIEKGEVSAAEVSAQIDAMDARTPANGARVVARAWSDPEFKARLLANGSDAAREMGFDIGPMHLVAVENTEDTHNLIVCTLCSCYPRNLLGLPPDWYKTREYRSRAVKEPRKVLSEFGLDLPENTTLRVHDSTADMRYIVLPARPKGTDSMDSDALAALVTRDSMIGVGLPKSPA
ncbi:nitrile hydratase subunit alpha [Litoreibacter roseus]|uniref:nitrile hydratase n=1 Tax=Litoreibacter roseus TaxID=2601869 RepID=A0A6N6JE36_9RHOB|nr:nitrile hydratase subunit alpha [Litoreibacter roseus]GFE63649.1 nitrile hydratase subunit alpha [Litoreibacter roseus]